MDDKPKKSLGQHWLTDEAALGSICDAADVVPEDTVLEIGPGQGTLTKKLVERAGKVVAVEVDTALTEKLAKRLLAPNLVVVGQDIMRFDFGELPTGYKIVANIPYYLTGNLLRLLTEMPSPPSVAVLLVQKEVAERVAAGPGDMSVVAVAAQFYYEVTLGKVVPAKLFTPPPKVDSQILILKRRPQPLFDVDAGKFFRLVKAGFAARRKTLANSLSGGLRIERAKTAELIESVGLSSTIRAQALTMEEWRRLYEAFTPLLS